jgi:hypothetical protein
MEIDCEKCLGTGLIHQGENTTNSKECGLCLGKGRVLVAEGEISTEPTPEGGSEDAKLAEPEEVNQ